LLKSFYNQFLQKSTDFGPCYNCGMNHRVVFMGSPDFAVPSLRALVDGGYDLVGVVTQPDRPAGRGGKLVSPAVKRAALELGLASSSLKAEAAKDSSAQWLNRM
jgi:methionyl-tRNA formyltransferase